MEKSGKKNYYNIASRAAQSNSVYVSVLKISIVHADSVSKSLRQNAFFLIGYKQRLGTPVPKRRQFSDLWARVLK